MYNHNKNKVYEEIFKKHYRGERYDFPLSDLPKDLLPDDIISVEAEYDAYTHLRVYRERDKTPEELEKDKQKLIYDKELTRERQYKSYLKLKELFEPEGTK